MNVGHVKPKWSTEPHLSLLKRHLKKNLKTALKQGLKGDDGDISFIQQNNLEQGGSRLFSS